MNLRHQSGITILELLIVVAILGILTAVGVVMFKPNPAKLSSSGFATLISLGKTESLSRSRPVMVSLEIEPGQVIGKLFVLNTSLNNAPNCGVDDRELIKELSTIQYGKVINAEILHNRFYWLPNGSLWLCNQTPPNSRITESNSAVLFISFDDNGYIVELSGGRIVAK